jgi:hypothetical protein
MIYLPEGGEVDLISTLVMEKKKEGARNNTFGRGGAWSRSTSPPMESVPANKTSLRLSNYFSGSSEESCSEMGWSRASGSGA